MCPKTKLSCKNWFEICKKARVSLSDSDRWGATPIDDARKFGHTAVTEYLEKSLADWDSAFGSSQVKIRKTIHRTLTFEISVKI